MYTLAFKYGRRYVGPPPRSEVALAAQRGRVPSINGPLAGNCAARLCRGKAPVKRLLGAVHEVRVDPHSSPAGPSGRSRATAARAFGSLPAGGPLAEQTDLRYQSRGRWYQCKAQEATGLLPRWPAPFPPPPTAPNSPSCIMTFLLYSCTLLVFPGALCSRSDPNTRPAGFCDAVYLSTDFFGAWFRESQSLDSSRRNLLFYNRLWRWHAPERACKVLRWVQSYLLPDFAAPANPLRCLA